MCLFSEANEKKMLGHRVVLWHLLSEDEFSHCRQKKTKCPLAGSHSHSHCRLLEVQEALVAVRAFCWHITAVSD